MVYHGSRYSRELGSLKAVGERVHLIRFFLFQCAYASSLLYEVKEAYILRWLALLISNSTTTEKAPTNKNQPTIRCFGQCPFPSSDASTVIFTGYGS